MKKSSPKLLFFITEDWYFWSHRLPLAQAALKNGLQVSIVCRVSKYAERIKAEGFDLIPINIDRSGKNPFKELILIFTIIQIYRRIKPNIVHHVALKPSLYGSLAAKAVGIKNIVNALAGLGHLFISDSKKDMVLRKLVKVLFHYIFKLKNAQLILQNDDDRDFLINSCSIPYNQTNLIKGSGVDTTVFCPVKSSSRGAPIIILLSRMLWTKGVGEFVEAAGILKGRGQDCRMILVGDPDPFNPASVPLAQLLDWHAKGVIEYWGRKDNVTEILQQCTISVLPSYREGLPKSLIESAAVGLPLIAFDTPGCREIVRDGENGILVPFKDVKGLALAMEFLLKNPLEAERMGQASRGIAVSEFAQKIVIDKTMETYKTLLGGLSSGKKERLP